MINFNFSILLMLLLACFTSCSNDPLDVDVSAVEVPDFSIKRLDQDLFTMDTADIKSSTLKLQSKYGNFYPVFFSRIINNGDVRDSAYALRLKQFIYDRDMRETYEIVRKVYSDTDTLKEDLTGMFRHLRYYFPEKKIPSVVTMISGYNQWIIPVDSTLAIGLEMYLGSNNKFYRMLALPQYKTMFMNKENIVPDATRELLISQFPYNMDKSDFLSEIIYMGKIMYLTDALLPEVEDSIKIRYSKEHMEYCKRNEFNVWSYFAAQKLLYTTDQMEIMKFTSEGPFTSALSKESAPRIGYWIGWQIVRQYMKANPEITVQELILENDAQKILTKAKYKPSK
jgi:gliding motility-associated lipoprotein GldB